MQALPLALALGVLCACGGGQGKEAAAIPRRPSIVLLSIDTLGAGHTSFHGYSRKTTPRLDELAAEAVVFERCLSNAPFTGPSYVSQFTGLLPNCSAVDREEFRAQFGRAPRAWEILRIPAARQTLTEMLHEAGYRTAAFVDNPHLRQALGIGQGFELFDTSAAAISATDPEGGIRAILPKALAWIDGLAEDEPFFLFVNVIDVHEPNVPPKEFKDRFADDGLGEPDEEFPVGPGGYGSISPESVRSYFRGPPYPKRMRTAPLVARYDEEILAVDDACGGFFEALRTRGLFDDLLLVFSADHGEAMGQPDFKFGHGTHVDQVLHVPLLLKLPGSELGGMRIDTSVQLLDLYPTLAELVGLEPPADLQGQSVAPLLWGRTVETPHFVHECGRLSSNSVTEGEWRLVVSTPGNRIQCVMSARGRAWLAEHHPELDPMFFVEHGIGGALAKDPRAEAVLAEAMEALRGPFAELYHVPSDPFFHVDLAAEQPEVVARLLQRLTEAQEHSALERKRVPVTSEPTTAPADLEELRLLGYAGDSGE